jgi:hypothetical protein
LPRPPFASSFLSLAQDWLAMTVSGIANTFPSAENCHIHSPSVSSKSYGAWSAPLWGEEFQKSTLHWFRKNQGSKLPDQNEFLCALYRGGCYGHQVNSIGRSL